jgi:hypothetical protein
VIVAFSTSSPVAGVALIDPSGELLGSLSRPSLNRASGACLAMLDDLLEATGRALKEATLFAADIGPGSFTGVRVGVTLAKTLAYLHGTLTTGTDAFDLISPDGPVAIPSRKGEFFVRRPGEPPVRTQDPLPSGVFGYGFGDDSFPLASGFARLIRALPRFEPERLNPAYLIEPSISQPKKPYAASGGPNNQHG